MRSFNSDETEDDSDEEDGFKIAGNFREMIKKDSAKQKHKNYIKDRIARKLSYKSEAQGF